MLFELFLGGITHHTIAPQLNYCNVINKSTGTIKHRYGALLVGNEDFKIGGIIGQDSVCAPIRGLLSSTKITDNLQFMLGGYNVNTKQFLDRGIQPVKMYGITPLIGLAYKIPIYENENIKTSFDTLISFGIISHGISVKFWGG